MDEKEISNFFANFMDRLSLRLINPAEGDDDLERVWRSFADESEGKSYNLARTRLERVQTLKNKFPDWNVSLSSRPESILALRSYTYSERGSSHVDCKLYEWHILPAEQPRPHQTRGRSSSVQRAFDQLTRIAQAGTTENFSKATIDPNLISILDNPTFSMSASVREQIIIEPENSLLF